MEWNFTPELRQAAPTAKSAEELQALAKEHGMDAALEQAREYCAQIHKTGELDNVSGGCRAIALALTGEPLGAAKCLFWKGGYPEKLGVVMRGWELGN